MSLLTGSPVIISHLRAKRANTGLMPQHLKAIQAAAEDGSGLTRIRNTSVGTVPSGCGHGLDFSESAYPRGG